jgi:two-component system cell cycle sensor histidine kinase PleC
MKKRMQDAAVTEKNERIRARRETHRRATNDLRETRRKLAQGSSIKPEFEYEMLSIFVRNELSAAFTITGLSAIFSLASMFWAPVPQAILWLFVVIGARSSSSSCAGAFRTRSEKRSICASGGAAW